MKKTNFFSSFIRSFVFWIILIGAFLFMRYLFDPGTLPIGWTLAGMAGIVIYALTLINVTYEEGGNGFWTTLCSGILIGYPVYLLGKYFFGLLGYQTAWIWATGMGLLLTIVGLILLFLTIAVIKELFWRKKLGFFLGLSVAIILGYWLSHK